MRNTFLKKCCPVCESKFVLYCRDVTGRRTKNVFAQYYCMFCESFFNPSGYTEDEIQLERDAHWHIDVEERNLAWSKSLCSAALKKNPKIKSVLEIGCGTGTLLKVFKDANLEVYGYDINPFVKEIAKTRHNLDIRIDLWNAKKLEKKIDLLICISTLEHIENPRNLFSEISIFCKKHNSSAYISVPFFDKDKWDWFYKDNSEKTAPFFNPDCHINHFSKRGFIIMAGQFGAKSVEYFPHGWRGYWVTF
jgi:SAM-dependent methyltransferase